MKNDIDIEEQDMKDEIDIEEHDVLDNPRIRTIFPDLAQIKKEIAGDYHGPDSRMQYQLYSKSEDSRQYHLEDTSESARFGNKIILGRKPSSTLRISEEIQNGESVLVFGRKSVEIKQEAEKYEETTEEVHHLEDVHEEKYNSVSTVLVLGSSPSSSGVIEPLIINDVSQDDNELAKSKTKFFYQEIDLNCEDNDSDHDIHTNDPKDPTTALVLLDNWGPRLENSSCYCKECLILFPTTNTLLAHNMTAHSFLVAVDKNKAVKSTAKLRKDRKKPIPKVVPQTQSQKFQCQKCNAIFIYYGQARRHRETKHPESSQNIFKKITNFKNKFDQPSIKPVHHKVNLAVYNNTLYKCKVCRGHFLTKRALKSHVFNNKSIKRHRSALVNCPDCNFTFKQFSLLRHSYVHHETMKLQREDFKIKYIDDFIESDNESDVEKSDNKSDVENTSQDSADNSQCSVEPSGKFGEGDNASSAVDTISYKTNNTDDVTTSHVKNKQSKIFSYTSILYKCGICNAIFQSSYSIEVHLKEHPSDNQETVPCFCGLNFSRANLLKHTVQHHDKHNLLKDDLYILTMGLYDKYAAGKHLFRCEACQVCFSKLNILKYHLSTVEHSVHKSTCPHCGLMFLTRSLPWHVKVHHSTMKLNREDFVVLESFGKNKLRLLEPLTKEGTNDDVNYVKDDDIEELTAKNTEENRNETFTSAMRKKRRSKNKNAIKNKLYQCGKCKTCFNFNRYMKRHYAECKSIQLKKKCDHCQLLFLSKSTLRRHIILHHRSDNFIFRVILVNYDEMSVISRVVKIVSSNNLLDKNNDTSECKNKNANKFSKLYQCDKCKSCFNSSKNIKKHYAECESIQPNTKCDQCQLMFLSKNSLIAHINRHHRSDNFKLRVILVNSDEKSAFSQVVKIVSSNKLLDKDNDTSECKNKNANKFSKLYQCGKCKSCFNSSKNIKKHYADCESIQPNEKCNQCQLMFFSQKSLSAHLSVHHRSDNFRFHVILVNFDDKSKNPLDKDDDKSESKNSNANKLNKLYQCGKCKSCFKSKIYIKRHYRRTKQQCEILQRSSKCDQCSLMFSKKKSLNWHINLHHRSDNFKFHVIVVNYDEKSAISQVVKTVSSEKPVDDDTSESENKNAFKNKLYQCGKCKSCFNSSSNIKKHYAECESIQPNEKCNQCQLMFSSQKSLSAHLSVHHRSDNFKFRVILVNYDEMSVIKLN